MTSGGVSRPSSGTISALVQFRSDEAQPLAKFRAPGAIRLGRREGGVGKGVSDILQDGSVLGQHGSVVELQRRDHAERVDRAIVFAGREQALGMRIDLDECGAAPASASAIRADMEQASGEKNRSMGTSLAISVPFRIEWRLSRVLFKMVQKSKMPAEGPPRATGSPARLRSRRRPCPGDGRLLERGFRRDLAR